MNGLRHGKHLEYYRNGSLAAEATFHRESYIGKCLRYTKDNNVILKMELDSSETGNFTHYNKRGDIILATGYFKNGFRDSIWSYYDASGKLINTEEHDADKTHEEAFGQNNSSIPIVPYIETVDQLFMDDFAIPIEITPDVIIDSPDKYAEFPGGIMKMKRFIANETEYPASAMEIDQQGKVFLSFIIELDGSLTNIEILRGVSREIDMEAKRVIQSMPKWTPAVYKGKKVRSRCRIPISFVLQTNDNQLDK